MKSEIRKQLNDLDRRIQLLEGFYTECQTNDDRFNMQLAIRIFQLTKQKQQILKQIKQ